MDLVAEQTNTNLASKFVGHLGLIAGMCDELGIAEIIDEVIPSDSLNKKVSHGQCVVAMVLNGLGFTNKALYLFPEFFEDKPIDRLIGQGIQANDLNDDALGRTLDAIYKFNPTELYSKIAIQATKKLGLKPKSCHLDSTSFHVDGQYNDSSPPDEDSRLIHVTKGYSRDHRPELNQVILNLIVENQASIPLFMQTASGNSTDKKDFTKIVKNHVAQIKNHTGIEYVIADSALYHEKGLKNLDNSHLFITRVPETFKESKALIKKSSSLELTQIDDNYSYHELTSTYGDCPQRWFLIKSIHAQSRESRTVRKRFLKGSEQEYKNFTKICRQKYSSRKEVIDAYGAFSKTLKFTSIHDVEIIENKHHHQPGKPLKGAKPKRISFSISGNISSSLEVYQATLSTKGFFILATNDMNKARLSPADALAEYKGQNKVEKGFRFLKSPYLFASSLYLKKVERIMSLMMIMTVSLMVYAAIEYRIRQELVKQEKTFPHQTGKLIKNPTAKWIFDCFVGVHILMIDNVKEVVLNLQDRHKTILECLGSKYRRIYS